MILSSQRHAYRVGDDFASHLVDTGYFRFADGHGDTVVPYVPARAGNQLWPALRNLMSGDYDETAEEMDGYCFDATGIGTVMYAGNSYLLHEQVDEQAGRPVVLTPQRSDIMATLTEREWDRDILYASLDLDMMVTSTDLLQLRDLNIDTARHVIAAANFGCAGINVAFEDLLPEHGTIYLNLPNRVSETEIIGRCLELAADASIKFLGLDLLDGLDPLDRDSEAVPVIAAHFTGVTLLYHPLDHVMVQAQLHNVTLPDADAKSADPLRQVESSLQAQATRQQAELANRIREAERDMQVHLSRYLTANEALIAARRSLAEPGMRDTDSNGLAMLRRMLDEGTITSVSLRGDVLSFDTNDIYIQDDRSLMWHDIGRFRVTINIDSGHYRFHNLTRNLPGIGYGAHPHVTNHGDPCIGSLADAVPELRTQRNWPVMVEMAMAFLQSANTRDSAGSQLNHFPVVPVPEAVGLPPHGGTRPYEKLPMPEVTEGDYGEFGQHCLVSKDGTLYYLTLTGYMDYDGTLRRRLLHIDADQYNPRAFRHDDILMRRGTYYVWSDEHQHFLDQSGRTPRGVTVVATVEATA